MTYTKAQKKSMRNTVYQAAKHYKKQLEDRYPTPNSMARLEMLFPKAIMEGNFKMAIQVHRELKYFEDKAVEMVVFNETDDFSSEDCRVGCKNIKINNENRRVILKGAMTCDARVGYWQLSQ